MKPMKNLISNAFSLNMLNALTTTVHVMAVDDDRLQSLLENWHWESVVGHADTAAIMSDILKRKVEFNRATITLDHGDMMLVGQYSGPRLEEGTKTLPEGTEIRWYLVSVEVKS
jgi:hypothetical protein